MKIRLVILALTDKWPGDDQGLYGEVELVSQTDEEITIAIEPLSMAELGAALEDLASDI